MPDIGHFNNTKNLLWMGMEKQGAEQDRSMCNEHIVKVMITGESWVSTPKPKGTGFSDAEK